MFLRWCFLWWCFCSVCVVVFLWWCGGVFVAVVWGGGVFVVVFLWRWCFCGGVFVVVFLKCLCGGVFVVVVFLWWCGGVFVVVFLWWCFLGGVCVVMFFVVVWWCFCGGGVVFLWWWYFFPLGMSLWMIDSSSGLTSSIYWISFKFLVCLDLNDLNDLLDHTSMSTSSISWSSMIGSCASISLTRFTWLDVFLEWRDLPYLTWLICLELFDFTWFALLPRLLFLACIPTFQKWSVIGNRHVECHHLGVTRNALRENRLVIFGLCLIGLRCHGPFISCHIFLPLCFALSGTHLGFNFLIK